jgi:hypothetical protein
MASVTHPAESARPGLSLVAFLAGAWLAAIGARALSPALPGSAIGIADLIRSTQFVAACVSQLVAAGGIALCVRLLGAVLPLPGLGVGLRLVSAPATLAVVALVVSSATRPLEPELTFVLAATLPLVLLCPVALLGSATKTRLAALILIATGLASAFELSWFELSRRGIGIGAAWPEWPIDLLDFAAATLAIVQCAKGRRRAGIALGVFLLLAVVPAWLARHGANPGASGSEVLLYRSLEALRAPALTKAGLIGHALALAPFAASLVLFRLSWFGDELCVALGLCLLARAVPGAPIATLFGAAASLLTIRVFYVSFRQGSGAITKTRTAASPSPAPSAST